MEGFQSVVDCLLTKVDHVVPVLFIEVLLFSFAIIFDTQILGGK